MFLGLALIFLGGLLAGRLFRLLHLPSLLGMLLLGIALGPYTFGLLDDSLLAISTDLRRIALVIILTRAGLSLDLNSLKRVGHPAFLLCFLPALCEICGIVLLAPSILGLSTMEALLLGTVLAAVSPAVVVPHMVHLLDTGYGVKQGIPQMILAGASLDDIFVLGLFSICTGLMTGESVSAMSLIRLPLSLAFGIVGGILCACILRKIFSYFKESAQRVVLMLAVSFLLLFVDDSLNGAFSGLLAIMTLAIALSEWIPTEELSAQYNHLWVGAEPILFVLVGASVNITYAARFSLPVILVIAGALLFRMAGVLLCMVKTPLRPRERAFCMLAYTPKATVQAAIGAIPLSLGLACGQTVVTAAVLSILLTAPLGAIAIDVSYPRCLQPASSAPKAKES